MHAAGLYLDREGRWFHDGQHVRHVRLSRLLHRSIAQDTDGGLIVTTGRDVLPFSCEDTPLFVRTVREDADGLWLVLSDERSERLDAQTVRFGVDDRLRVKVRDGTLWALAERAAHQTLQSRLQAEGDDVWIERPDGGRVPVELA